MRGGDGAGRALAIALTIVVLTLGGLGWFVWSRLDSDALKPKLIAAVRQATGRTLTISGAVGLNLTPTPTLVLNDVALANPPGFSRPETIKIARLEVAVALAPLLERRLELGRVTLVRPDILIESTAAGQGNWTLHREPPPSAPAATTGAPATTPPATPPALGGPGEGYAVSIEDLRVVDGHIAFRDGATGRVFEATVPEMTLNAPSAAAMTARGTASAGGVAATFELKTGAANQLRTAHDATPWPFRFEAAAQGASVALDGRIAYPLEGKGYSFAIDAEIPDPTLFAPLFPGAPLAAMKRIAAHTEFADGGPGRPVLSLLRLTAGSVDLAHLVGGAMNGLTAGAKLENATLTARGDAPMQVSARLAWPGIDGGLSGTAGDLNWLAGGGAGPVDVALEANMSSARARLKGRIEAPARRLGYVLDLNLDIPDPAALWDAAPRDLKAVEIAARLSDSPGTVPFRIASNAGGLTGEAEISWRPRPTISVRAESKHLDLDIAGAPPRAPPAAILPPAGLAGTPPPAGQAGALPPGNQAATPPPGNLAVTPPLGNLAVTPRPSEPPDARPFVNGKTASPVTPAKSAPVFSAEPWPLGLLTLFDANLSLRADVLRFGATDLTGATATLVAKDGVARLDPFSISGSDRKLDLALEVDAAANPPRLRLTLRAPMFPARTLLGLAGGPPALSGMAAIQADLTATGASPKDIAASLTGWAGLALEHGQLDAKTVNGWLDQLRPLKIEGGESTELRCLALRIDAKDGIAALRSFAFNTAALIADGGGEVDLRRETLALRLRPRTRIGGTGVAVPLRIAGTLRAPAARLDLSGNGAMAGLLLGGKDIMGAAGGGDPCPVALARARNEAATPDAPEAPNPTPAITPPITPPVTPPTGLLRLLPGRSEEKK